MEKEKRQFGRRDFLKMVGVSGAVGGAALAASSVAPKIAKAEYDKPHHLGISMAVKYLDQPNYDLPPYADGSKMQKHPKKQIAFENKEVHKIHGSFGDMYRTANEKALKNTPGWTLRDLAFADSGWASKNDIRLDWGEEVYNDYQEVVDTNGPWDQGPEKNALTIKKVAASYGSGATGICELHERWLYSEDQYIDAEKPNKRELIIPKRCNNAIVMLLPLDSALAKYQPTGFNPANGRCYSRMSELVNKMAHFLRILGWTAIPCWNDVALSIPFALDAGLGELGRHGLLINPEYGSACKICKLFTDMPLAHDKPISFGAAEFCKTCGKCADKCPSKSISHDPEPSYNTFALSNYEGMKKWYVNTDTCFGFWISQGNDGCNVCAHVCTYSKPQTWVHDVIKVTTSKTSLFNSVFAKMDDAFGYGAIIDEVGGPEAIEEWWDDPDWTRQFDWERHTW